MKKSIIISLFSFIIGSMFGVILFSSFQKGESVPDEESTMESSSLPQLIIPQTAQSETETTTESVESIERSTTNQKETEAISAACSSFVSIFFSNDSDQSYQEKEQLLGDLISETGKKKLLKDYNYQEGTDTAVTKVGRATNYVKFDSVTGKASVMSFMIFQTIYPDQPVLNAQTIVSIHLTKNEENKWQIDNAEMRLLNQAMPESFFS
ncbi:hypothetical protein KUB85_001274 [Enterococcus faecalis]|uniref:hypothetical protein n=1 Tax=Enterococcus faecalis TaxID=1351 RepID=UPI001E3AC26A|nr:hypothetical protein [Enterococcus faecalis]EHR4850938.1 hypothetical protein [Enterococcus faecalis]EMC0698320.1 hypothetical protein [Enterococcus faecalis]MCD5130333.1 hypothetical protein [Enterococcus faecalis]MDV2557246.1 hypothetical protein [Enterococcus faecalis]MDY2531895.1 hypothetical protein [Enterococcus faecalis]